MSESWADFGDGEGNRFERAGNLNNNNSSRMDDSFYSNYSGKNIDKSKKNTKGYDENSYKNT